MKIWLVSIFEQTPYDNNFSTRYLSIAEQALQKGHEVTFFASTFRHNTKTQRFEETKVINVSDKYKAIYLRSNQYKNNFGVSRFLSHFKYASDLIKYLDKEDKPDVILVAFPPIFLANKSLAPGFLHNHRQSIFSGFSSNNSIAYVFAEK
jgi:hypothetical protein